MSGSSILEERERNLLQRLRAGEDRAYEELVREHGGRLLAVARRFLANDEDAQDALQEAFLSAFRSIDRFEGNSQLGTWLHRIVVNASLMKLRTRKRHRETGLDDLLPRFLDDGHHAEPATDWRLESPSEAERKETGALVRKCIERLPPMYRTVLLLRDIEELSTEETARHLEVTPNAVKVRLHRARQALRGLLDPYFRGGAA